MSVSEALQVTNPTGQVWVQHLTTVDIYKKYELHLIH